jgi:Ni/Co efflux regulator RcnB
MRSLMIAAVVATMAFGGTAADAQRLGPQGQRPMPMPNPKPVPPQGQPMPRPNPGSWTGGQWRGGGQWNGGNRGQWNGRSRWGSRIGGFWWAGVQAPGGWNGYTRVKRGKRLPGYWVSPSYIINDWQMYGLGAPPAGYYWSRYYNDAVLIDSNGTVYDSIGGVDWDRYQGGYAYDQDYAGGGYADYPPAPQGGPGYGAPYPAPGYGGSSSTTTYTYSTGGGYAGGGYMGGPPPRIAYGETYYVAPGSVVTVTMPGAVTTTTTTTTEYIYERRYVAKKVWRKPVRKWRPRPKPRCTCAPAPIRGS